MVEGSASEASASESSTTEVTPTATSHVHAAPTTHVTSASEAATTSVTTTTTHPAMPTLPCALTHQRTEGREATKRLSERPLTVDR